MSDKSLKDPLLNRMQAWKSESANFRAQYDQIWVQNLKIYRGIFDDSEVTKSRMRGRSKIYYRKVWATVWRLTASFYNAFLRDPNTFKIEGRGPEDVHKAEVLQKIVEYRRDRMFRTQSLFLQFVWAFQNIGTLGSAVGKLSWKFDKDLKIDEPEFVLYPNEQVYPDLSAELKHKMRYVIFVNYMTMDEMKENGYINLDKAVSMSVPSSVLRQARHENVTDPLQNPSATEYPTPGRYNDEQKAAFLGERFEVWECFYKEKGKIKFCVTNVGETILKDPVDSPYGERYPLIMGGCLTEPHKMIGEGFPAPLAGPQESLNAVLNMRKDNVAMSLNRGAIVDKRANVDLHALVNARSGRIIMTNDINGIKFEDPIDVTHSAYIEASADEAMMAEMSGVTAGKQGMGSQNDKATVAQINYSESNAKIDLYIALVGETFMKDFFSQLTYLVQKFETDEKVYRIANESFREKNKMPGLMNIYDLGFEADCIVSVGAGTVGKDIEQRQTMLAMDRAIMSNQSLIQLITAGIMPPEGVKLFDTTAFMKDILPNLGKKDIEKYFLNIPPPQQQVQPQGQGEGDRLNPALAGAAQPQIGGNTQPVNISPPSNLVHNMLQRGGSA